MKICPNCGCKTYVVSIFGSICGNCFFTPVIKYGPGKNPNCRNGFKKGHKSGMTGKAHSKEVREKIRKSNLGHIVSEQTKQKISKGNKGKTDGEKNILWKGENVGYVSLHQWVARKLGKPKKCAHCGNESLKPRQYHWANKSREYHRDLNDWIRLCVRCHTEYDGLTEYHKKYWINQYTSSSCFYEEK